MNLASTILPGVYNSDMHDMTAEEKQPEASTHESADDEDSDEIVGPASYLNFCCMF